MEMDKKFYEKRIEEIRVMLKCIERGGIDALHEIDKPKGVEWAKNSLNEQIEYFMEKLEVIK